MIFRALWPVLDEQLPFTTLVTQARRDLPALLRRAHARPISGGRWSLAESALVPGSGRVTEWVLLYECPARRAPHRALHHAPTERDGSALGGTTRPAAGTGKGKPTRQPADTHDTAA